MKRGNVLIIPNDNVLTDVYTKEIPIGEDHIIGMQEFASIYEKDLTFKYEEYQEAPCILSNLGHLVIKSDDFMKTLVVYLPNVVTDRQINYLTSNFQKFCNDYIMIGGYYQLDEEFRRLHGLDEIMIVAKQKNIKYEGKDKNVR